MTNRVNLVLKSFMGFSEAKVLAFFDVIITALTDNANFPTAKALLATFVNAQADYAGALSLSKDGNCMQAAEKNVAKLSVLDALRELCSLVNFTAAGNKVLQLSSGFDISIDIANPIVIEPLPFCVIQAKFPTISSYFLASLP